MGRIHFSTLTILILGGSSSKPYLPVGFNFCKAKDSCRHELASPSPVRLYLFDIGLSEILGSLKWPKSAPPRSSDRHSPRLGIVAAQSAGIDEPPTPDQTPNIEFWDFVKIFWGLLQEF